MANGHIFLNDDIGYNKKYMIIPPMVKWLKYLWSIMEKMMHKKVRKLTVTSKMKLKLKLVIMTVNFPA